MNAQRTVVGIVVIAAWVVFLFWIVRRLKHESALLGYPEPRAGICTNCHEQAGDLAHHWADRHGHYPMP